LVFRAYIRLLLGASAARRTSTPSVFSIYGDEAGPSTICEQPVGAQADVFIASLGEKNRHVLKKFLENSPRQRFSWREKSTRSQEISREFATARKPIFHSSQRVRRVKWRHLSTDRMSIYRYSLPAITYEKSKRICDCIMRRKKVWLLGTWLTFILFLCVIVVLGSLSPEDRMHPYVHFNSTVTQITLQSLRNISIGCYSSEFTEYQHWLTALRVLASLNKCFIYSKNVYISLDILDRTTIFQNNSYSRKLTEVRL
uniref:SEA domain-containing protein n=1 Tax=Heligmosomoides polygyrus TaxID=6339 RepID=A0A183FU84_HELPZ